MTTKISGGDNFKTVVNNEKAAEARMMPIQETRLAAARTPPF